MDSGRIADIKIRAERKTIHELRQIARAVGVARPSGGKKERLIEEIIKIATCEIMPSPRNARGAPPKSTVFDEQLVSDIEKCINYYSALKSENAEDIREGVSDGAFEDVCSGILSGAENNRFLQTGCIRSANDVAVHESFVSRFNLKPGDYIRGVKSGKPDSRSLTAITYVNGFKPENLNRIPYGNLTSVYPEKRISLYCRAEDVYARMLDFFAPAGLGQRCVITGSQNCGLPLLLKQIGGAVCAAGTKLQAVFHIIAGRPEDINYFRRNFPEAEVYGTVFSDGGADILEAAELVSLSCKRRAECGGNVVLIADGLSRLETAAREAGVPGAAKRFLASAVCAEEGGSLTVIGTASPDDAGAKELCQAANMQAEFKESYAIRGIDPPMDILKTFTSDFCRLQPGDEVAAAAALRKRVLNGETQCRDIVELFKKTENNGQVIREVLNG